MEGVDQESAADECHLGRSLDVSTKSVATRKWLVVLNLIKSEMKCGIDLIKMSSGSLEVQINLLMKMNSGK